jgi:hypothetical protein
VVQTQLTDTGVVKNSLADVVAKVELLVDQLPSKACEELARRSKISRASSKEETCAESSSFVVFVSDCARNSRLPCTSHAVQLADAPLIAFIISPGHYLLKNVNSRIRKANGIVLLFTV